MGANQPRECICRAQAAGSAWAWPFQDAMGIALMLLILRQFQLPSIKARAVPHPCVSARGGRVRPLVVCGAVCPVHCAAHPCRGSRP